MYRSIFVVCTIYTMSLVVPIEVVMRTSVCISF
ncbi:hypothetical protein SAMN05216519_4837 [Delftia acidovorans]|nr:hypothetical protein SAMN05216519_4837 [Delftia acidovorans]